MVSAGTRHPCRHRLALVALFGLCACSRKSDEANGTDPPIGTTDSANLEPGGSGAVSTGPIGAGLPEQTYANFPDCTHPAVDPDCTDGWCRIPAGCFIMGSPETEWRRGAYSEDQVAATLSRPFLIQQREVRQSAWTAQGLPNPSSRRKTKPEEGDCLESECPVGSLTWFEAVAFANVLSERHDPPLEPCYQLLGCTGELGTGMVCEGFELTAPTAYDCEGFRLPTEAEWEYAARAGTRTAFYSGDITAQPVPGNCYQDQNLDPIAWYCQNAGGLTHPVGQKRPNGWALFDMLGNVSEWVHDTQTGGTPPGPLTDPGGTSSQERGRLQRGGNYLTDSGFLRAASGPLELSWDSVAPGDGTGFRLVRTLQQ